MYLLGLAGLGLALAFFLWSLLTYRPSPTQLGWVLGPPLLLLLGLWWGIGWVLGGGFAVFVTLHWLGARARQQKTQLIEGQTVDALLLLSSSLRAGFSLLQALQLLAREIPPPLKGEIEKTLEEVRLGSSLGDALARLESRMATEDWSLVGAAISIQLKMGGDLAQVLEEMAAVLRERIRLRGRCATLTSQGRLSGRVMMALAPLLGLALYLISPEFFIPFLTDRRGQLLLGLAAVLEFAGGVWIRRISQIRW